MTSVLGPSHDVRKWEYRNYITQPQAYINFVV